MAELPSASAAGERGDTGDLPEPRLRMAESEGGTCVLCAGVDGLRGLLRMDAGSDLPAHAEVAAHGGGLCAAGHLSAVLSPDAPLRVGQAFIWENAQGRCP